MTNQIENRSFREATIDNPIVFEKTKRVFVCYFDDTTVRPDKPFKLIIFSKKSYTDYKKGKKYVPSKFYGIEDEIILAENLKIFFNEEDEEKRKREEKKLLRKKAKENYDINKEYKIGDIYYTSWGYEQTNIDFYQVVEVKKASIVVRPICQKTSEDSYMAGITWPLPDNFSGEPETKRIVSSMYKDHKTDEYFVSTYLSTGCSYKSFYRYDMEKNNGCHYSWYG